MQTIEEYKEYTKQLEGEVKQWHDAFDASQAQVKELAKENLRLERERVEQNAIIETCANELEELRLHEVEWDLAKARIKELEAENKKIKVHWSSGMIGVYKKTTEGEKLVYKTDDAARATDYKAALETIDQESEYTCRIIEGKE